MSGNGDMTFHEVYGEVSKEQLRLYKKNNVSRSDHDSLDAVYGDDIDAICAAVRAHSPNGVFSEYTMRQDAVDQRML